MFCTKCGRQFEGDSGFCTACGTGAGNSSAKANKKGRKKRIIIIGSAVAAIVIGALVAAWLLGANSEQGTAANEGELITKDASELVLTVDDLESGWVLIVDRSETQPNADSAYYVQFRTGSDALANPPTLDNKVAVYPNVGSAQSALNDEKPKDVSLEYPDIGDASFFDTSNPLAQKLVFRENNVLVWVTLYNDTLNSPESYAEKVEQRILAAQ